MAKYGNTEKIEDANHQTSSDEIEQIEILQESNQTNDTRIISREDFPLDNRKGSGILTSEHKVQKTITNNLVLECQAGGQARAKFGGTILSIVETEVSVDLSARIEQSVNQTVTREDNLTFSVQPGDFVIYTIIWKCVNRSGEYLVKINEESVPFNYEVQCGLSYSIESKKIDSPIL